MIKICPTCLRQFRTYRTTTKYCGVQCFGKMHKVWWTEQRAATSKLTPKKAYWTQFKKDLDNLDAWVNANFVHNGNIENGTNGPLCWGKFIPKEVFSDLENRPAWMNKLVLQPKKRRKIFVVNPIKGNKIVPPNKVGPLGSPP